jgi:hypothetical protein
MTINTDITNWAKLRLDTSGSALAVKRSDVDVFTEPYAHALFHKPEIFQGQASNDEQLFAIIRSLPADTKLVLVGHGWSDAVRFTVELTPDEFLTHWKGD